MSPKPSVLILYYTQTGQMLSILKSIVQDITEDAVLDFVEIQSKQPYNFPWKPYDFFNVMPETVMQQAVPMHPLPEHVYTKHYDLVILGYQPWYLNPSLPVSSFLQSEDAVLLKGKKVLTVIGARNMWLHAQERVKAYLLKLGADLVGNIALVDSNSNIISTMTVKRWAFTGQKEASRFLPEAGVQQRDIIAARRFGPIILDALERQQFAFLQDMLLGAGAIHLNTGLVVLENRGITNFRKFAPYIQEKGGPNAPERASRVNMFGFLLNTLIFILTPVSAFSAFIQKQIHKRKLTNDVDYFKSTAYEEGRI